MQDVVEHFSARTVSSSSPPTRRSLLSVSLSGQLTGSCRAFPATRPAGKRPSAALFDVPSPLILFTWTALCARFLLNRSSTHSPVLSLLCNHSSFNVSISPRHRPVRSQIRAKLWWFQGFLFSIYFPFFDFFSFCFSTLNMLSAGSCLDVSMVAKVCRCVAQMPYFPSVACLELWFVGSLACRDHFLLFSGKLHQKHSVRGKAATRCYMVKWERIVHVMVLSWEHISL